MKSIENKITEIIEADQEGNKTGMSDYKSLIGVVIRRGKQGGFTWDDVERRTAISKQLKDCNGSIELEDADYSYLKKLVEAMTWPFYHEDLLTFKEDFIAAGRATKAQ